MEIRTHPYLSVQERYLCMGDWFSAFWTQMGVRVFFLHWLFPKYRLFQDNQYGKGHILGQPAIIPNTNSGRWTGNPPLQGDQKPRTLTLHNLTQIHLFLKIFQVWPHSGLSPHWTDWRRSKLWLLIPNLNSRCSLFVATQKQIYGSWELHVWVPKFLSFSLKSVLLMCIHSRPCFPFMNIQLLLKGKTVNIHIHCDIITPSWFHLLVDVEPKDTAKPKKQEKDRLHWQQVKRTPGTFPNTSSPNNKIGWVLS